MPRTAGAFTTILACRSASLSMNGGWVFLHIALPLGRAKKDIPAMIHSVLK
jgi:hypothetical protein